MRIGTIEMARSARNKNWLIADSCGCLEALDAASSIGNKPFPAPQKVVHPVLNLLTRWCA
ncbi:hypothetical protein BRM70_09525 [Xanthomonas oryzae pv. oryzae]|nr:hypothetical protein BRM70_09525 [Xanthomonas oryzae pv. oryzae]